MTKESKRLMIMIVLILILSIAFVFGTNRTIEDDDIESSEEYVTVKLNEDIMAEELSEPPILSSTELQELGKIELEGKELYFSYVDEICKKYDNVDPSIIKCMMFKESTYRPDVYVGDCVGLMQVSKYWHRERAEELGVTDFFDPYSNILVAVDYVSELSESHEDIYLVLMLYNMKRETAFDLYSKGEITDYATTIVSMASDMRGE